MPIAKREMVELTTVRAAHCVQVAILTAGVSGIRLGMVPVGRDPPRRWQVSKRMGWWGVWPSRQRSRCGFRECDLSLRRAWQFCRRLRSLHGCEINTVSAIGIACAQCHERCCCRDSEERVRDCRLADPVHGGPGQCTGASSRPQRHARDDVVAARSGAVGAKRTRREGLLVATAPVWFSG